MNVDGWDNIVGLKKLATPTMQIARASHTLTIKISQRDISKISTLINFQRRSTRLHTRDERLHLEKNAIHTQRSTATRAHN
jgi:hypothetical protein